MSPITIDGMGIALRPFTEADRAFVKDSWLRSAFDHASLPRYTHAQQREHFYGWARPLVEQHVSLDYVRIACPETDANVILGWSCMRERQPLYAYTSKTMRGQGLMRALTETP